MFQKYLLAFVIVFILIGVNESFAETESMIIAARSSEQIPIYLNEGDYLEFIISVRGGSNDDIDLTIFIPGGDQAGGFVYEEYSDTFVAPTAGTYVFSFDNTFSLISNKSVRFSYERIQNTYYVYVNELPKYAKSYAGDAVYDTTEFWKEQYPELNFYVADTQQNADILIQWVRDFGGNEHVGFQYVRLIEVGLGDSKCYGKWKEYSSVYVTTIMAHEIGHSIGFEHSNDPEDIMYPYVDTGIDELYSTPCVSPQSLEGTKENVQAMVQDIQQGAAEGGGCLIATAAFGSEMAPQVQQLRELRDNTILKTSAGTAFMNGFNTFYYSFSPTVADWEREYPLFKESVKVIITPLLMTLSLLNHVEIDSEEAMLGYGIGIILLNIGLYSTVPVFAILAMRRLR